MGNELVNGRENLFMSFGYLLSEKIEKGRGFKQGSQTRKLFNNADVISF